MGKKMSAFTFWSIKVHDNSSLSFANHCLAQVFYTYTKGTARDRHVLSHHGMGHDLRMIRIRMTGMS